MSDGLQYVVIGVVVALAVTYMAWRIYHIIRHSNDPCYGCEGCALKEMKRKEKVKKCPKNLQDTNN